MTKNETEPREVENVYCDNCGLKLSTQNLCHWYYNTGADKNDNDLEEPNPADLCIKCYVKLKEEFDEFINPFIKELAKKLSGKSQEIYHRIMGKNDESN